MTQCFAFSETALLMLNGNKPLIQWVNFGCISNESTLGTSRWTSLRSDVKDYYLTLSFDTVLLQNCLWKDSG